MKAALCRAFGAPLAIEEVSLADPGQGEVHVRLNACAICQSDITYMDGGWGGVLPSVFGHEAAGIVQQIGKGVSRVSAGESVIVTLLRSCGECYYCERDHHSLCETTFALDDVSPLRDGDGHALGQGLRTGAFAEEVVVHESQVLGIPPEIPMASAALLSCGVITGFGAVSNVAGVTRGTSVITIGTGGVGLNCVQGAALCGSEVNIAVDLSGEKIEAALRLGATHGFSADEDLAACVSDLTAGRGADYVFIAAGSASAVEQGLSLARRGGTVVLVGMTAQGVKAQFETLNLANDAIRLLGSKMGQTRLEVDVPRLVEHYLSGRLKLDELISGCYPLDGINDAIMAVKKGQVLRNVIVFER